MSRLAAIFLGIFIFSATQCALGADTKDDKESAIPKIAKLMHLATGKVMAVENDADDPESHVMLTKDRDAKDAAAAQADGGDKANAKKPSAAMLKAQQWKLEKDGADYKIVNRKNSMALDVPAYSTDEDTQIIIYDEKPGPDDVDNQRWTITVATLPKSAATADPKSDSKTDATAAEKTEPAPKLYRIRSKSSDMVLDVDGDGYIVQRHASGGAKSQLWMLVEVKD